MPKISIITPIYCDTPDKLIWLDEMIRSVVGQTVADWELILINDKSPLSLDQVKLKYATDNRLRWLENAQNEGPATTRNTAVAIAQSDCILPLDSDDLLADNEVLEAMYDVWAMDKTKIIYGNLWQYKQVDVNRFSKAKLLNLGEYTFELAMDLRGVMPVTAMHSVECHYQAGGWKKELAWGLEDVEYWIAAGKAGFCGQKMGKDTLLYRVQDNSRARKMYDNDQFRAMQYEIKDMHSDIYKGEFPMACCGKGSSSGASMNVDPVVISQQNQGVTKITELEGYEEKDLEWITYQGGKRARFDILARGPIGLPTGYTVLGTGHCFQIHKRHSKIFSDRQHMGFRVNQPDPRNRKQTKPVRQPEPQKPQVVEVAKPELSTLVRMDNQMTKVEVVNMAIVTDEDDPRTIEQDFVDEIIVEPNPPESYSDVMVTSPELLLSDLKLSERMTKILNHDNWTVEKLSVAQPEVLALLPGIGLKTSQRIIDKAQELINSR